METPASTSTTKFYTRAEVAKHNDSKSTWFIIHNSIYDVSKFLNEVRIIILHTFFILIISGSNYYYRQSIYIFISAVDKV